MTCAFDKERLTGYFDGELESAERSEVEQHISACSECLRDLGEIKSAALLVRELPRHRAPRSIAEGVSREIAAAGRAARFRIVRGTLLWATAAAAALLIAVNVAYFAGMKKESAPAAAKAPPASAAPALAYKSVDRDAAEGLRKDETPEQADREDKPVLALRDGKREKARRAVEESAANAAEARKAVDKGGYREAGKPPPEAPRPTPTPPPAPAALPASGAAKKPEDAVKDLAEVRKGAKGDAETGKAVESAIAGRGGGAGAPVLGLTVAAADPGQARAKVETLIRKVKGLQEGGPGFGAAAPMARAARPAGDERSRIVPARPAPLSVELTESELAALRKEIGKEKSLLLVEGSGEEAQKRLLEAQAAQAGAKPALKTAGGAAPGAALGGADEKKKESGESAAAAEQDKLTKARQEAKAGEDGVAQEREFLKQQAAPAVTRVTFDFTGLEAPPAAERK